VFRFLQNVSVSPFSHVSIVLRLLFQRGRSFHAKCEKNLAHRLTLQRARIQLMLFENTELRIEGNIIVSTLQASTKQKGFRRVHELGARQRRRDQHEETNKETTWFVCFTRCRTTHSFRCSLLAAHCAGRILVKGDNITLMMNVSGN
jgi:hypothetical protein